MTGQRADGYHLLDSLVCFADIGDQITIQHGQNTDDAHALTVIGPFANDLSDDGENLVLTLTHALEAHLNNLGIECSPVHITLEKNLPIASGIGGGSADAAAMLVLLHQIWAEGREINLHELALPYGADIPMCLDNQPKRVQGIGEQITQFPLSTTLPILLVNPGVGVSTPNIFSTLADKINSAITFNDTDDLSSIDNVVGLLQELRNDLQQPAIAHVPEISDVLNSVGAQKGCLLSRMSGSGATCFGIFDSPAAAQRAMTHIKETHPQWWSVAGKTIAPGETA